MNHCKVAKRGYVIIYSSLRVPFPSLENSIAAPTQPSDAISVAKGQDPNTRLRRTKLLTKFVLVCRFANEL